MAKNWKIRKDLSIEVCGHKLFRIECTQDFKEIKAGNLGGYIEKDENLDDDAWVCGSARVYGSARVCGSARVYDDACVCGSARVYGSARVCDDAYVCGKMQTRNYEKDGRKVYVTEVVLSGLNSQFEVLKSANPKTAEPEQPQEVYNDDLNDEIPFN